MFCFAFQASYFFLIIRFETYCVTGSLFIFVNTDFFPFATILNLPSITVRLYQSAFYTLCLAEFSIVPRPK